MSTIPIIILCYNNYKYVQNTINQLVTILGSPDIRIFNNNSSEQNTLNYLSSVSYPVINNNTDVPNQDTWVPFMYDMMPDVFAVTGPSVLFNDLMPSTFLDDFTEISIKHNSRKTGPALLIDDHEMMYRYRFIDYGYDGVDTIFNGQTQYWTVNIPDERYQLFRSPIDNSFSVYNKNCSGLDIRVAGVYTSRVISWYVDIPTNPRLSDTKISRYHRYLANCDLNTYQPIRFFELQYLTDQNINEITKRNNSLLVQFDGSSDDDFWRNTYSDNWEEATFDILDRYLDIRKPYLEIGGWIGDTSIYASRNSSLVVTVEPDVRVLDKLNTFISNNYLETEIIVDRNAVGTVSDATVYYSLGSGGELQRTYTEQKEDTVPVNTISFNDIITRYNLSGLSLINININGSEEYILQDAYDYSTLNGIPLYITFYYSTWENNDLSRFSFLTVEQQAAISGGVTSILFND